MTEPDKSCSAATEHAAESAIRDWWYGPEHRLSVTSEEVARSLIWHLAKCGFAITRTSPAQAVSDPAKWLYDLEVRAVNFSIKWGAGGSHAKMMAAFAGQEIAAQPPAAPVEHACNLATGERDNEETDPTYFHSSAETGEVPEKLMRATLQRILDNRDNKNWRKPEIVQEVEHLMKRTARPHAEIARPAPVTDWEDVERRTNVAAWCEACQSNHWSGQCDPDTDEQRMPR